MTDQDFFPKAKKSLGQNFLLNSEVVKLMVEELDVVEGETIFEVGCGTGVLTKFLAEKTRELNFDLIGIEFDKDLATQLQKDFKTFDKVKILNANILNYLERNPPEVGYKILGSLPYNITSPLLHQLIDLENKPTSCVFLIQKEVAEKICETQHKSSYLSCLINTFFETSYLTKVDRSDFHPEPKVHGAVMKLTFRETSVSFPQTSQYEKFLHRVFLNPRKMLNKTFPKDFFEKHSLDATKRPEDYSWEVYWKIFNATNLF